MNVIKKAAATDAVTTTRKKKGKVKVKLATMSAEAIGDEYASYGTER